MDIDIDIYTMSKEAVGALKAQVNRVDPTNLYIYPYIYVYP